MASINTYNSVPSVYIHKSRDFQVLSHLFDAVFNQSKNGADMVDRMFPNEDFDERLQNLSATTVGFVRKHEYNTKDLNAILSSFAYLLRIKGTKTAIEDAINILLRSQGISDEKIVDVDYDNYRVNIYASSRLTDTILLRDLFAYILPVGFTYRFFPYSSSGDITSKSSIIYGDSVLETSTNNYVVDPIVHESALNIIEEVDTTTDYEPRLAEDVIV